MIGIRVNLVDKNGKKSHYDTEVNGTLATAREYFVGRILVDEVFDYSLDKFVEVRFQVESVELVED